MSLPVPFNDCLTYVAYVLLNVQMNNFINLQKVNWFGYSNKFTLKVKVLHLKWYLQRITRNINLKVSKVKVLIMDQNNCCQCYILYYWIIFSDALLCNQLFIVVVGRGGATPLYMLNNLIYNITFFFDHHRFFK